MNIIDIVILGFILLYALNGMYKGFLPSLLNLGGFFLSWIGAFLFYPLLSGAFIKSDFFQSWKSFYRHMLTVPDGSRRLPGTK